jgi:hypothetical protein
MKDTKLVEKYQLVIKDLFENDYHKIVDDEDLVGRLFDEVRGLNERVGVLEDDLYWAREEVRDLQGDMDILKIEHNID